MATEGAPASTGASNIRGASHTGKTAMSSATNRHAAALHVAGHKNPQPHLCIESPGGQALARTLRQLLTN